jgi:A/G-specific adenine glycosylase
VAVDRPPAETSPRLTPARAKRIRQRFLDWYDAHRRDLPWRHSRDPYAIWISETMLQQTRVETVIPYYERFLARFPDVRSLADASQDDVYACWAGLGYYSRARNLHSAARRVADDHDGELPPDADALRELPGIGRYTAGAVASIAFALPEPIVDGNVKRVLARLLGIREDVNDKHTAERIWAEAGLLARGERPGDLNQALMELGATVCTPRSPRCMACPFFRSCDARKAGDAESLPRKSARTKVSQVRGVAVWLERRGRVLAVKREAGGLLGGLWELPGGDLDPGEKPEDGAQRLLSSQLALSVSGLRRAGRVRHVFTHRELTLHVLCADAQPGRVRRRGIARHRWLLESEMLELPAATVTRKAITAARS